MSIFCDDCIGMGIIRREGETPKEDTWDICATCEGAGEIFRAVTGRPKIRRRRLARRG